MPDTRQGREVVTWIACTVRLTVFAQVTVVRPSRQAAIIYSRCRGTGRLMLGDALTDRNPFFKQTK